MDRLTAMRVFREVAQSGSFTAAADRLDMSRAMVTRYVTTLEQWLEARLLQRTTRRVTLTDAGEQCLRRCLQVLELVDEVEAAAQPAAGELHGQLRLTCSMSFAIAHLAQAVADFLAQHPRLTIDLDVADRALNLIDERIDLAVRITADPAPGLVARPLARCRSMLVAAPSYIAAHGLPDTPSALAAHAGLSYTNFGKSTWRFSRGAQREAVSVRTRFTANEATVLLQAAIAGGGIALQPVYLVGPYLADGRLVQVLPDWQVPELTIYALYASRRHLSPAVRALLDYLVERFRNTPW
ncbi:LysR family transcriptional regulator [Denitromonas iodatirespirans]|uniref:LysR family transcriptional regulator n=1 Tax=Denitromonas iodatirespirans TaxID=2795389 RepID=A0A944D9S4_DENI1|nr:LysR family transcriptional regulator [Denitromonas iodatirespirans]MBT0961156.1 LysR family transcriptional regulator [Denitromonas iodatirespirans]